MAEKKYLDLLGLQKYDEKIKAHMAAADSKVLEDANQYFEDNADRFDAAGTAATKVQELADGAVKTNTEDISGIKEDIGNVDNLQTTSKNLTDAVNEAMAAIGTGGTAAVVAVTAKGASEEFANVYEVTQGGTVVGTINIPRDMVVESGSVVDLADGDVEGYAAGKYIKLVLQNVETPLYIAVASLVDIYVAKAAAAQVQIEINSSTREISAYIVAGSVTSAELADGAVVTAKIADSNVTKAKLSAEVQASLDKADVAESNANAYTDGKDSAMDLRVKAIEEALSGSGEGTVEEKIAAAKQEAIDAAAADATSKANTAESNAASALAAAKAELEGKITDGDKANKDLIDGHDKRIEDLEAKVGEGFIEITDDDIDALFATV